MAFPRGARPSARHSLLAAEPYRMPAVPPDQAAWVPAKLSYWLNNQYGDCVTAEEAFKCACDNPEDFIEDDEVKRWCQSHNVLEGAMLDEVLDWMAQGGFKQGGREYRDGGKLGVDYSNEELLRSAIAEGPVKIGIDASALPSGAGNNAGWFKTGGSPNEYRNTDHCVALCGYGPAQWLYQQLGVPLPSGLQPTQAGYLLFTWSTIGFVDHAWIMSTTTEAWLRRPSTVKVPPDPTPPAPPTPPQPPAPSPTPWWMTLLVTLLPVLLPIIIQLLQQLLKKSQEWASAHTSQT